MPRDPGNRRTPGAVDPELSEVRRRAGRRGAAARWSKEQHPERAWRTARPAAKLRQGRNDWYRIENRAASSGPTVTDVYIYDEIGYFGITSQDFVLDLKDVTSDVIALHLNTPGGDVFDGLAIYKALRDHKATVEVTVDALAASAGSFIAQAGDRVAMARNASIMIHDAHGLTIGNADDHKAMADVLDMQSDNIASIYAERAGGRLEDWRAAMRAETWYDADEAVEAGLADEVEGDGTDQKNTFDLSIFSYAGRDKAPAPAIPDRVEPPSGPAGDPSTRADGDVADGIDFDQLTDALRGAFA